MISETGIIAPIQVQQVVGPMSFDLKGSIRDFYNDLTQLLRDYGDPDKDVTIDGTLIKAKDKYGPYGTLVFTNKMNTLEQTQTTLFNVYNAIYQLEKTLSGGAA